MNLRKYKSKKTGLIFNATDTSPKSTYVSEEFTVVLPSWIVEDSCDFEEIKPVLFTTEDGFEITDRKQDVFLLQGMTPYAVEVTFGALENGWYNQPANAANENWKKLYKVFSSSEARQDYISDNKRLLSYKDVANIIKEDMDAKFGPLLMKRHMKDLAKIRMNEAT